MDDDDDEELSLDALKAMVDEPPIIRVVNLIISQAINDGATAIHIDAGPQDVSVRYRVDGILHEVMRPPRHIHLAMTARIKIMGAMDVAERRIPQDGIIRLKHDGVKYDCRVAVLPCAHGEKVAMRIHRIEGSSLLPLDQLGMTPDNLAKFQALLRQPHGLIMVGGRGRSGLSTLLYSALAGLNETQRNVVTIEQAVERRLAGLNQIELHYRGGMNLYSTLRSCMRADADVIMVGELQGLDAYHAAIDAACARHLVLAGCNCESASQTLARLLSAGVEPYLLSLAFRGAVGLALPRRACPDCQATGCDICKNVGYRGQVGVQEVMWNSPELARLIARRAEPEELHSLACREGMVPLREDGLKKVSDGLTTLEEVIRVTR